MERCERKIFKNPRLHLKGNVKDFYIFVMVHEFTKNKG